jgi:hypothetical protein
MFNKPHSIWRVGAASCRDKLALQFAGHQRHRALDRVLKTLLEQKSLAVKHIG